MPAGFAIVRSAPRQAIAAAAARLVEARRSGRLLADGWSVDGTEVALAVQHAVTEAIGEPVVGWKCAMPLKDRVILAPIYAGTIVAAPGPVRVKGREIRYEAELAFTLDRRLDPGRYDRAEILSSIGRTRLALELVHGRFADPDEAGFDAMLADGLFNEGIVLGPTISADTLVEVITIEGTTFRSAHPASDPLEPLIWLINYLGAHSVVLEAETTVITGAFAPAHAVRSSGRYYVGFGSAGGFSTEFIFESDTA